MSCANAAQDRERLLEADSGIKRTQVCFLDDDTISDRVGERNTQFQSVRAVGDQGLDDCFTGASSGVSEHHEGDDRPAPLSRAALEHGFVAGHRSSLGVERS